MTTTATLPITLPVLTPRGNRIPLVGTLAFHDALGFCTVISRTQSALRLSIDDIDGADDVTLTDGTIVSRAEWLERVAVASVKGAKVEVASIVARVNDEHDAFYQARPFAKSLIACVNARIRKANEMVVSIDAAERCGWEFDEYATWTPKKNIKKAAAPKPVVVRPAEVEELEDDTRPDWLVAEMNACFGDKWVPNAEA